MVSKGWYIQKKAVPLRDFSRLGLSSSATEGTDDAGKFRSLEV